MNNDNELMINKKNGNIAFNEEKHLYWDLTNLEKKFTSVTTMIETFTQPYDKEFWSGYKALESILQQNQFKFERGGLLSTKKIHINEFITRYGITLEQYTSAKQSVLDQWEASNKASCIRGTAIHSELENNYYKKQENNLQKFGIGGTFVCKQDYTALDIENGIYPEYLIYDLDDNLAGQIDLLVKEGNDITIIDYKSNKKIDKTSYFNSRTRRSEKMKSPLSSLDDCNFMHYTMQLSTYAYMLQKLRPEFNIKRLAIEHHSHEDKVTLIEVEYKKDLVIAMIKAYIKNKDLEERRNRRKPIIY